MRVFPPPINANVPQTHKHAQCCSCKLYGCPCGYFGDPVKECTCSNSIISRYQKKISGPLLDRIDIHVEVPRVEYEKLAWQAAWEEGRGMSMEQAVIYALDNGNGGLNIVGAV